MRKLLTLWIALAGFALLLSPSAESFARSKPALDEIHSPKGTCGPAASGTPLAAAEWENNDGHYRVRLSGAWIDVPDDALVTGPNSAGHAIIWPLAGPAGISIRCFMP
jgi:hypothetical protein